MTSTRAKAEEIVRRAGVPDPAALAVAYGNDPVKVAAALIGDYGLSAKSAKQAAEKACAAPEPGADDQDDEVVLFATPEFPGALARGPLGDLCDWAAKDGLPVSFVAAAGEVAGAGACAATAPRGDGHPGPGAKLRISSSRVVLPILWAALVGDSGDGKNPSIERATEPIVSRYDALLAKWEAQRESGMDVPRPQALMQSSAGMEAIARWLSETGGAGILRNGELASFLRGLGQYKSGGGSDRYDAMDMWSGEPVSIERVGQGGKKNGIQIYVRSPRLSVVGGLVLDNVRLLGSETDGLRARFLPALPSSQVIPNLDDGEPVPDSWNSAIRKLYECTEERTWTLGPDARQIIRAAVDGWNARRMQGTDPVTVRTALAKADEQCLRIALVVSELESPGKGGEIPAWAATYAVKRVDYALGCWLAIGSDQTMAFSRKDEVMNTAVSALLRQIERRPAGEDGRRWMTRRDIQQSQVGGATTPALVDELIRAYLRAYPRTVVVFSEKDRARFPAARFADRSEMPGAPSRGPAPVIVFAPLRSAEAGEYTLGKLLDPTVSASVHSHSGNQKDAGQSVTPSAAGAKKGTQQFPSNSFQPNSFQAARATGSDVTTTPGGIAKGQRTVTCTSCGTVARTAVEPGETAYCKQCDSEYTAA